MDTGPKMMGRLGPVTSMPLALPLVFRIAEVRLLLAITITKAIKQYTEAAYSPFSMHISCSQQASNPDSKDDSNANTGENQTGQSEKYIRLKVKDQVCPHVFMPNPKCQQPGTTMYNVVAIYLLKSENNIQCTDSVSSWVFLRGEPRQNYMASWVIYLYTCGIYTFPDMHHNPSIP